MGTELRARRREEILQAAIAEFCTSGYDRTTMEGIARRTGIGKSTVYEYFPSKIKLLSAAGDFVVEQIFQDASRMLSPDRPLREALGDYWEYIGSVMGSFGPHFLNLVGDRAVTMIVHRLCKRYMETVSADMERILRAASERGEIAAELDIGPIASIITTLPNPPFLHLAEHEARHAALERLLDLLFLGLAPR